MSLFTARREHDDRHIRRAANLAAMFQPIHVRQHQVEHNQIGLFMAKGRHRQRAIVNHGHLEAGLFEIQPHRAGNLGFVFNDKDLPGIALIMLSN